MSEEIWKDIEGYEGYYRVSNIGRVKSLRKNIIMRTTLQPHYKIITLYKNGKNKKFYIHRLVAFHFVENKDNKPEVNHIDGDKLNNFSKNLEWCYPKENIKHGIENGLIVYPKGEEKYNSILKDKDVMEIFYSNKSPQDLCKIYKIDDSVVYDIRNKKRWLHITKDLKSPISRIDYRKGKNCHLSKLDDEKVLNIYNEYKNGNKVRDLALKYDIYRSTIHKIVTGKIWKHLNLIPIKRNERFKHNV